MLADSLDSSDLSADGWSATELMAGLTHLAMNDENSVEIINGGILDHIRAMLTKGMKVFKFNDFSKANERFYYRS